MKKIVQDNVKYKGCFTDYAFENKQYQSERFFNDQYSPSEKEIKVSTNDARLPEKHKTKFYNYDASPLHYMPSIDYVESEAEHPKHLSVQDAVTRCYSKAKLRGNKLFGLTSDGICLSSNSNPGDELPIKECKGSKSMKKGGLYTNSVYEIQDPDSIDDAFQTDADEAKFFKKYKYQTPVIGDKMLPKPPKDSFFPLTETQLFDQKYFTPNNPIKGILTILSTGSGKTCNILNICGNFLNGSRLETDPDKYRVYWISRKSLLGIADKEMFQSICMQKLRDIINDPTLPISTSSGEIRAAANDPQAKIDAIRSNDPGIRILLANQYGIELQKQRIMSYDDFVKLLNPKTISDKEMHEKQIRHGDFGYKTLFCFDEFHNWTSEELPLEERVYLDAIIDTPIVISGKTFYDKSDISNVSGPLQGRDLLKCMLHRSYELSGHNSAKSIFATWTIENLPSMLNLLLPRARNISENVLDYFDKFSMKLNPKMMNLLAKASYGLISYLDVSNNPNMFALKLFDSIHTSDMYDFHRDLLSQHLLVSKDIDAVYRNMAVFAQVTGPVYSHRQIQDYLAQVESSKQSTSREYQTRYYLDHIQQVRKLFGLDPTPKDISNYKSKLELWNKYREKLDKYLISEEKYLVSIQYKNIPAPSSLVLKQPVFPNELKSIINNQGQVVSFSEWEDPDQKFINVPNDIRKEYESLWNDYKINRNPSNPILSNDGYPMSLRQYFKHITGMNDINKYNSLIQLYQEYSSQLVAFRKDFEHRKQYNLVKNVKPPGKKPELPVTLKGFSIDGVNPLSIEDWVSLTRSIPTNTKFTDDQYKFTRFLMIDPNSQKLRMKQLNEFVSVVPIVPSFPKIPEDTNFSFLCWSKKFNPEKARELLVYYAPCVYNMIQNIIAIEKSAYEQLGHGYKHMVFTFSTASKQFPNHGSRAILSAFAAFPEIFQIMVQHSETKTLIKKQGTEEKYKYFRTINNVKEPGKWGVTCMSSGTIPSENIPGNEKSYPKILDFSIGKTAKTVETAWEDPQNKYGERIKIIILDGAFSEGIETTEVTFEHFIGCPEKTRTLIQASSRGTRQLKSQELDFFPGVGAFVKLNFYELFDPLNKNTIYDQMLANMKYTKKLTNYLSDKLNDLIPQLSIDYSLTSALREFNPIHIGIIVGYDERCGYIVDMNVILNNEPQVLELIVDYNSITNHKWSKGKECFYQNELGYIRKIHTDKAEIQLTDLIQLVNLAELLIPINTKIEFHIPNGISLASKLLNIGDVNNIDTRVEIVENIEEVLTPEVELDSAQEITFLSDPKFFLLGLFGVVTLLKESNVKDVDLHIVLPLVEQKYYLEPDTLSYSIKWTCIESERVLQFDSIVLEQFLKPMTGISIMILRLEKIVCKLEKSEMDMKFIEGSENRELVNWLIYIPERKIIERFDPRGNRVHTYDIIQLDSKLFDLFQALKPDVNYMCLSQSEFLEPQLGLSHASIFSLIYMHSRILEFVSSKSATNDSPLEFQSRLLHSLKKKSSSQLVKYASGYTKKLLNIKNRIIKSKDYLDDMPFWSNAIIQLNLTLVKLQGKFNSKNRKQLTHLENMDELANNVFQAF